MIVINDEKKKEIQNDNAELAEMGLTYAEYNYLKQQGIDFLMQFEENIQKQLELAINQSETLKFLLANSLMILKNSIMYGYGLIVNTPPLEIYENQNIDRETALQDFKGFRKILYNYLKKDFGKES